MSRTTNKSNNTLFSSEYPDAKSEFIAELSERITYWRGRAGKDAAAFASAYENVLRELLTPEQDAE